MTLRGFPALKIEIDASVGGALTDISAYVTAINGLSVNAVLEEISAAGDSTDRWGAVGFTNRDTVVISGPYDDQANSLVALTLDGEGEQRSLQLTFDDPTASDVKTVEALIEKTARNPSRGAFHQYEVTLRLTGAFS